MKNMEIVKPILTDRAKPLEQEPGPSRVLELYTGPALAQVVWRDLYFLKASNYVGSTVENRSLLEFAK